MKLILERKWTNESTTHGVLSIEGTKFRCLTLELADRDRKNNREYFAAYREALPPGTYNLRPQLQHLQACFPCFYKIANFNMPMLSMAKDYSQINCGDIAVGTAYDGDYGIKGAEKAIKVLGHYAEKYEYENHGKRSADRDEFVLEVRRAPDFEKREGSWEQYVESQYNADEEDLIDDDYD